MSRSNQQPVRREPIRDRNYVMPFGKYKGESIADLLFDDPAYLEWLHANTDFELHADLLDEVQTSYEGRGPTRETTRRLVTAKEP